jgi:hypothetical protein
MLGDFLNTEGTKQCFCEPEGTIVMFLEMYGCESTQGNVVIICLFQFSPFLFAVGHAVPAMNYERRPKRGRRSMFYNHSPTAIW